MCSKLTIKKPEQRHWRRSGVFLVNFDYIAIAPIVDFEQVNVSWDLHNPKFIDNFTMTTNSTSQ